MLIEGIPVMFALKSDYFGPSFEFVFKAQLWFYDEMVYQIDKMKKELGTGNCRDYSVNETKITEALNEIRHLSITLSS